MKYPTLNVRRRVLARLGPVGMALILSLGMPATSGMGPIPVSEATAEEPEEQFRFCFWGVVICIGWCVSDYGFCCDGYPEPLL